MIKIKSTLAKQITAEEQALKNLLSSNLKNYRHRRNWSQFTLAAKINILTNFLADIEAGNTWISAQTLAKLAQAFEIEAFELLKPQKEETNTHIQSEADIKKTALSQFSQDLTVVLQESMEKAFDHVKKQYEIG
jgi:transcriptional regulator with XRE-family HTH domain